MKLKTLKLVSSFFSPRNEHGSDMKDILRIVSCKICIESLFFIYHLLDYDIPTSF
jgi:hypothetical protein